MAETQAVDRRRLGIYYTPTEATHVLCSWAIRSPSDALLEPSFGACGFLAASRRRLQELECSDPARQLFGCDIDETAFHRYLWPMFGGPGGLTKRFLHRDFLSLTPEDFPRSFDAVIGNPPYVANSRISPEQRKELSSAFGNLPYRVSKRADLWVYFVLHSLQFLRPGGRMAWILPGSFLQADYAGAVHRAIQSQFRRVIAIQLGQKLFVREGAKENTIVVLADGWQTGATELKVGYAPTLQDLKTFITGWDEGQYPGVVFDGNAQAAFLPAEIRHHLADIEARFDVQPMDAFCCVRIGIVTGANRFFVLTRDEARQHSLPNEHLRAIVSKFSMVPGVNLTETDLDAAVGAGCNCLLVDTQNVPEEGGGPVQRYLGTFDEKEKQRNRTFKKRTLWHRPDDGRTPDAFLSYMHEAGPRLSLNVACTTSTNTVHRVYFRPQVGQLQQKAIAVSLLSVFAQLWAEVEGRAYGSGVLKHEPSGAKKIRLLMPRRLNEEVTIATFEMVDRLLRDGKAETAQAVASRWAFSDIAIERGERAAEDLQNQLANALREIRRRRHHPPVAVTGDTCGLAKL